MDLGRMAVCRLERLRSAARQDDENLQALVRPRRVMCVESFIGAPGERDGLEYEEMVLAADGGRELLTSAVVELIPMAGERRV